MTKEKKRSIYKELFELCGIEEMPPQAAKVLNQIPYKKLIIPLVKERYKKGVPKGTLAIRYGLNYRSIKWILEQK